MNLGDYLEAMGEPEDGQVGYVAAVDTGGQIFFYADIFGNQDLYGKLHQRLHQSVAAVAGQANGSGLKLKEKSFENFLESLSDAQLSKHVIDQKLAGDVYIISRPGEESNLEGSALVLDNKPVQLSLRQDLYKGGAGNHSSESDLTQTRILHRRDF